MRLKAQSTTEWILVVSFIVVIVAGYFTIVNMQKEHLAQQTAVKDNITASADAKKPVASTSQSSTVNVETAGALSEIYKDLGVSEAQINSALSDISQEQLFNLNSQSITGYKKSMIQNAIDLNKYLNLGYKNVDPARIDIETISKILLDTHNKIASQNMSSQPAIINAYNELKEQLAAIIK